MVAILPFTFSVIPFYKTKHGHSLRMAQPKRKVSLWKGPHLIPQPESVQTGVAKNPSQFQGWATLEYGEWLRGHQGNISGGSHWSQQLLSCLSRLMWDWTSGADQLSQELRRLHGGRDGGNRNCRDGKRGKVLVTNHHLIVHLVTGWMFTESLICAELDVPDAPSWLPEIGLLSYLSPVTHEHSFPSSNHLLTTFEKHLTLPSSLTQPCLSLDLLTLVFYPQHTRPRSPVSALAVSLELVTWALWASASLSIRSGNGDALWPCPVLTSYFLSFKMHLYVVNVQITFFSQWNCFLGGLLKGQCLYTQWGLGAVGFG